MSEEARTALESIPYLALTVSLESEATVESGARQVLAHFIPSWNADGEFSLSTITDGLTNKLYKVKSEHGKTLVRVYGANTEKLIDRQQEMLTMLSLAKLGLSPPLYGRFDNGICYGYLPGIPFSADDMIDPAKGPLVAEQLARFHATPVTTKTDERQPRLFRTIRKWLGELSDDDVAAARATGLERPLSESGQPIVAEQLSKQALLDELQRLQDHIESLDCDVVFCHNDLLSGNILYQPASSDAEARVWFIDYEYGSYNYRCFDIGNHWAEWLGFTADPARQPSLEHQRRWLEAYERVWREVDAAHAQALSAEESIDRLRQHTSKFTLISHFHWGVWALV